MTSPVRPLTPRARRDVGYGRRRGFTMLEMLTVIVLLGIVMGGMMMLLVRQQRFYASARELIDMRSNVRQALGVLPADLRGVSSIGGDIYAMSDTSIEFRATFGSSVVCRIPAVAGNTIVIPPRVMNKRNTLTTWLVQPSVGDSLFLYDEGEAVGNWDDQWRRHEIRAIAQVNNANGCPQIAAGTLGLLEPADMIQPSYQITVSPNIRNTIVSGAPVRFFRRVRYSLYRAGDGRWYLGFFDCVTGRSPECSTIQPVSGPYLPASAIPGESGLTLEYFDETGAATADSSRVAQMRIVVRGRTQLRPDGTYGPESRRDSLVAAVAIRNRS